MFIFSKKSKKILSTIHNDLREVVEEALSYGVIDITVVEGIRDKATQEKYVKEGKSKTMNSKHLLGYAVDIYPYVAGRGLINDIKTKEDYGYWITLGTAIKIAGHNLGVGIEWGGEWKTFKDYPHFQFSADYIAKIHEYSNQ